MGRLRRLLKRRDELVTKLAKHRYVLRGTIIRRGNICGKAGCRCKRKDNPILHGPYRYLSHRSRKAANMIFLNKTKLKYALCGITEYRQLIELIYKISEINFEILRFHYSRLEDNP